MPAHGRFAPSPSSDLHLGNLRTALLAWLAARAQGARFMLRIDDLDRGRSREAIAERQLADLAALGIDHDGAVPRQSAWIPHYEAAFARLRELGAVYPCFCTRAEIREAARAPHGAPAGGYPGTCRSLTPEQVAEREAGGRKPAWRLRASREPVEIEDRVLGRQALHAEDAVLRRADGEFGYQLAVVVDDERQGVGEVVRGADLLDSCGTQRQLQRLLGLPEPAYAHVPLMLAPDGTRLAKRHGAVTLQEALDGQTPFALPGLPPGRPCTPIELRSALLATVGLVTPGEQPGADELIARFGYAHVPATSTIMA